MNKNSAVKALPAAAYIAEFQVATHVLFSKS
jgi:hypothetical protein